VPSVPTYRLHKPSGQAVITIRSGATRRDVYLGEYGSPESKAEYARLVAVTAAGAPGPARRDVTVSEILVGFLKWAATHYRDPGGNPTSELNELKLSLRPVRDLYGTTPAAEFGPLALKAVRQQMVVAGLCRTLVNRRVDRVRRVWKWAASEELIPVTVYDALKTVAGLREGRTGARESEPVGPADPAAVEATLPHLNPVVAAMVRVQLLTGMRPGEVCRLTPGEVARSGTVWLYTPRLHKTRHRGKGRVVPIGPKAQAVLAPFLAGDPGAPAFSPRAAREERYKAMRAARKTKVQPSQADRKKVKPVRSPAAGFTTALYAAAVGRAAKKAGAGHFHPNQLRHTFATEVRKAHGLEAAQVLLGHSRADVTQVYAERDLNLAVAVAKKAG
jgi:integrase